MPSFVKKDNSGGGDYEKEVGGTVLLAITLVRL